MSRTLLLWDRDRIIDRTQLVVLSRTDGVDFWIVGSLFEDWMYGKSAGRWLSSQFTEALHQLLLFGISEPILLAEKDDSPLRNYLRRPSASAHGNNRLLGCFLKLYELRIARSRSKSSAFGALIQSVSLAVGNSVPMMGVTSSLSYWSMAPVRRSGAFHVEETVVDGVTVVLAMAGAILAGVSLIFRSKLSRQEDNNQHAQNQLDVLVTHGDACRAV